MRLGVELCCCFVLLQLHSACTAESAISDAADRGPSVNSATDTLPVVCTRYNTHVVVNPAGELAASYRKVHLFDVDVPQGPVLMESRTTAPGDQVGQGV